MALELQLQLRAVEGAMLRVLGTIERRGYTLGTMSSRPRAEGLELCLELEPNGRPVEVLLRQLRKVYDAFGPKRMFWGSDISRLPCTYRQCVTLFTEELPWLKGQDLEKVMGRSLAKWIGWNYKFD